MKASHLKADALQERKAVNAIPTNQVDEAISETSISIGNIALTNTPPQSEGTKILVKSNQENTREPPTDTECARAETTTTNSQPHWERTKLPHREPTEKSKANSAEKSTRHLNLYCKERQARGLSLIDKLVQHLRIANSSKTDFDAAMCILKAISPTKCSINFPRECEQHHARVKADKKQTTSNTEEKRTSTTQRAFNTQPAIRSPNKETPTTRGSEKKTFEEKARQKQTYEDNIISKKRDCYPYGYTRYP